MEIVTMYEQLGVSRAVYEYGEAVLRDLRPRFDVIDQTAEYNQGKVLAAMQKNRVNATHFAATTGYGYNDDGRDNLERVYADVFHTEAALVRPQITCGWQWPSPPTCCRGTSCCPRWEPPMTPWRRSSASERANAP